jgi:hypothetical protein
MEKLPIGFIRLWDRRAARQMMRMPGIGALTSISREPSTGCGRSRLERPIGLNLRLRERQLFGSVLLRKLASAALADAR